MFKTRISILSGLFGLGFLVILGRLWQLQISRYEKYDALATREKSTESLTPSIRGQILDRYGQVLAEDRPFFDLSVRIDRLTLDRVTLEDVKAARALTDGKERQARMEQILAALRGELFVRNLAAVIQRGDDELAEGLLKALDAIARNWASPRAPQRIISGVNEKIWLSLRARHEDVFRDSRLIFGSQAAKVANTQLPPFPGLVCTVSTRRVYPHGRMACFLLGTLGELSPEDEEFLRRDGFLIENAAARSRAWEQLRAGLDDEAAARLERVLRVDPREAEDVGQIYERLQRLRPGEQQLAAGLGLAEPVRWVQRPPRVKLDNPEMLHLGVGLPAATRRNSLPDRVIGESGVERVYNDWVRGKSGIRLPESDEDSDANAEQTLRRSSQPREGETLALTLSSAWQHAVEKALASQERCGSIVVLDVKTGEVLAMASNPSFDPNLFVPPRDGAQRQEKLKALLSDPRKPLLNRAISEQYPLGSVMKTLVASVALQMGKVNTTETFECPGYIKLGGQVFHCDANRAHGTVNLYKAIRCSCNVTFHQIGARIGVENLGRYARLLLGKRTGIDLPAEAAGIYPDREWRAAHCPKMVWTMGNDYQLAIGQGQMSCTVLQAAVLMATVSNGGYVVTPRLWLDGPVTPPLWLGVSDSNLAIVREGLFEVVNVGRAGDRGTAYTPFHEQGPELAVHVAGKTSTAEHGKDAEPHAWFCGYAPAENPQVAFAVMLEDAGHGGAAAAPLAYHFLKEIYGTRSTPEKNPGGPKDGEALAVGE